MTSFRPFTSHDLLKYNLINTDCLTETYGLSFYLSYLAQWPEYFVAAETLGKSLSGYVMGKSEGNAKLFHGHVTALTVAPPHRRQKLANKLMEKLEHRHITRYIESFIQDNEMFIAVEWAQNGDLKEFIRKIRDAGNFIPELKIWQYIL